MLIRLFSIIAAVAAGCVSAFMFVWAAMSIFYGGPEGRVDSEAMFGGLISLLVGFASAYISRELYTAPARAAANPDAVFARVTLYGSPLVALVFIGMLLVAGHALILYFAAALAVVLADQVDTSPLGNLWIEFTGLRH